MKIIKVAFWQCLFLLQFANTADLELTTNENIKDFIVRFLEEEIENRTSFMNSFSETKISVEFFNDFKKHIDEIAVKSIRDYIDGKPRDKKLLKVWFEDVSYVEQSQTFPKKDQFIEYWNQILRNNLNVFKYGNQLRGYLDRLGHPAFDRLKAEIFTILSEWENEKRSGFGDMKECDDQVAELKKKFDLVFEKPISVEKLVNTRGSHEKYLMRDKDSNLFFKIVIVRPHGNKTSIPEERKEERLNKNIEKNLARKIQYTAPKEKIKKVFEPKASGKNNNIVIGGDLKARLHKYALTIDLDRVEIKNEKDKERRDKIATGREYFKRLPADVQDAIVARFQNIWSARENYPESFPRLDNKEDGKNLFCYKVVTEQENKIKTQSLEVKSLAKTKPPMNFPLVVAEKTPVVQRSKPRLKKKDEKKPEPKSIEVKTETTDLVAATSSVERNTERLFYLLDAEKGAKEVEQFINENRIDAERKIDGKDIFMKAVETEDIEIVKAVFNRFRRHVKISASVDVQTPLLSAIELDDFEMVKFLINFGVSIYDKLEDGSTCLTMASSLGNPKIVKLLLEKNIKKNKKKEIEFLNEHLNELSDSQDGYTALMLAADEGNVAIVDLLLQAGADLEQLNEYNETALSRAVESERLEVIDFLLRKNAKVDLIDTENNSLLAVAAQTEDKALSFKMVERLLKAKADPNLLNPSTGSPAHFSALNDLKLMKLFLKYKADFSLTDLNGTALTEICKNDLLAEMNNFSFIGLSGIVGWEHKEDILFDETGFSTAFQSLFSENMNLDKVKLAKVKDEYINFRSNYLADINNRLSFLLENKADPNGINNEDGKTPLHFMAEVGNLEAVKLLLKFSADKTLVDSTDLTALDYAEQGKAVLKSRFEAYQKLVYENQSFNESSKIAEIEVSKEKLKKLTKKFNAIIELLKLN